LAGGSYLDIMAHHGVSLASWWNSKEQVILAILSCPLLAIHFPDLNDYEALRSLARGFEIKSEAGVFADVVGALDGILVDLHHVSSRDSPFPARFWTRKSTFALNVQAVADSKRRFVFFSIDCPGSVHDSVAWMYTKLFEELEEKGLPYPFFLVADAAYSGFSGICTPYAHVKKLTDEESAFNFYLSQLRIEVECAFGALIQRWGILWRGLRVSLRSATEVIEACMRLHNYCIDFNASPDVSEDGHVISEGVDEGGGEVPLDDFPVLNENGCPGHNLWYDMMEGQQRQEKLLEQIVKEAR